MKHKVLKITQTIVSGGLGITVGIIAALGIIGVATTVTAKIVGGTITYLIVAGLTDEAIKVVTNPIVKYHKKK